MPCERCLKNKDQDVNTDPGKVIYCGKEPELSEAVTLAQAREAIQGFRDDIDKRLNGDEEPIPEIPTFKESLSPFLVDELSRRNQSANDRMVGGSEYKKMKMEPWDEMEATETKEDFLTYLRLAAKKHQLRLGRKEGSNILEDMEKAYHILEKWIEVYKSD